MAAHRPSDIGGLVVAVIRDHVDINQTLGIGLLMDGIDQIADDFFFVSGAEDERVLFVHRLLGVFAGFPEHAHDHVNCAVKDQNANQKRQTGENEVEPALRIRGVGFNQIEAQRLFDIVDKPVPKFHKFPQVAFIIKTRPLYYYQQRLIGRSYSNG